MYYTVTLIFQTYQLTISVIPTNQLLADRDVSKIIDKYGTDRNLLLALTSTFLKDLYVLVCCTI